MSENLKLQILGAGPAGLAIAYFAKKNKISFTVYEKDTQIGGNCKTIIDGEFRYDTGAHRFHDKNKNVTQLIKNLMGEDIKIVNAPSEIYYKSKMIQFPLHLADIIKNLKCKIIIKIIFENLINIFLPIKIFKNLKELSYSRYGKTLANMFLINYSEKLWGEDATKLLPDTTGGRLKGLNLLFFLKNSMFRNIKIPQNLDGIFYYPRYGFGTIFKSMELIIKTENILLNSPITKIMHNSKVLKSLSINGEKININDKVVSTLPLNIFINILDPPAPNSIRNKVSSLNFRHIRLAILYLNIKNFSKNASVYFPEKKFSFTRIYEPKIRSIDMAPDDKTCIVIEVPCSLKEDIYNNSDEDFKHQIISEVLLTNMIEKKDIIKISTMKMPYAYPVIEKNNLENMAEIFSYIDMFENLEYIGRSADFKYNHINDIIKKAASKVENMILN